MTKQKVAMPKSRGKDQSGGSGPHLTGMGKMAKPASYSLPPIKTGVKHPRGSK